MLHHRHRNLHPNTPPDAALLGQVVQDDGCVLPVALNAAVLALLDAGAPMKAIFTPFSRRFHAIFTPFLCHFHAVLTTFKRCF